MTPKKPIRAPIALAKIRELKATIAAKVASGEMTPTEGENVYRAFVHGTIAHVRDQHDAAESDVPKTYPPMDAARHEY